MEISRVKEILGLLAEGIDPLTGEIFPDDSPYQRPEVIRALYSALRHLEADHRKVRTDKPASDKAGMSWTAEEEEALMTAFKSGLVVKEIASQLGRSQGAITSRLQRLGLM